MTIPLLDTQAQLASLQPDLDEAIAAVLSHGRFVNGPELMLLEDRFAEFSRTRHCIGVSSGTDALMLCLRAVGIGPGDEVITSAMTFIATAESIAQAGGRPVLVDVDPDTALISADAVAAAITERTAAIVPVHLYGQMVDMPALHALAERHGLALIEDAAQAHGAEWDGERPGRLSAAATFSCFPGKNLGALGDAGLVTTNDDALAAKVRMLRDHGRTDKYRHDELGVNARLDTLQAAVLAVKLERLEGWNELRREHAAAYDAAFRGIDGIRPIGVVPQATSVHHQYVLRVSDRAEAAAGLAARGVATGVHYPIPLNRQPAMAGLVEPDGFPAADRLAGEVLSIPVYPELTSAQRARVIAGVHAVASAPAGGRAA